MRQRLPGRPVLAVALLAACSSGESAGPPPPSGPAPVASVTVSPAQITVEVGSTAQLTAQTRDAAGNVLTGRTVSWSSSNASVATVDGSGVVRGVAAGPATITATSEGRSGTAAADVRSPPISTIEIAPAPGAVAAGLTLQLTATAKAANGTTLAGKTFTWASSNEAIARVNTTGLVTGVTGGEATISASAEGVTGRSTITVTPASPVAITQVAPATLIEGQAATITGSGFSETAAQNTVRIDGVAATVTQATTTTLQVTVPSFDCRPRRTVAVQVSVGAANSNPVNHAVAPASFVNLAVGAQAVLTSAAGLCLQFDAAAATQRYVFGVQSVSEVVTTLTPVTVTAGVPSGASSSPPLPAEPLHTQHAASPLDAADLEQSERWQRHVAVTAAAYERERRVLEGLGPASPGAADLAASPPTVPGTVTEGAEITVRLPSFTGNSCTDFMNLQVRVRRISNRAIFVEDVANPAMLPANVINDAATNFETIYGIDVDWFGEPGDIDQNQRIVIVITREVNRLPAPPLGFVAHSNLFTTTQCPASNEGEFFFMRTSDATGQFTAGVYTAETLTRDFTSLLIHELAHIIQGARRRAVGGPFMTSWLAEALATGAQEIAGFQILNLQNGLNYGQTVAYSTRGGDPRNFFNYIGDLITYFGYNFAGGRFAGAPEECSWVGNTAAGGYPGPCDPRFAIRILYGVPWTLIRHISNRHLGGQASFKQYTRAFSEYTGQAGFAELVGVLGRPIASMMADWAPIFYIDDRYATAPNFQYTTWNIRDVTAAWNSPNAELPARTRGFAAFTDNFNVRAGSSAYYDVSGANRPATAIRFRDGAGNPLPAFMQVWVVRVQ